MKYKIGDIVKIKIVKKDDIEGEIVLDVKEDKFSRIKIEETDGVIKAVRKTQYQNKIEIEYLIQVCYTIHGLGKYGDTFVNFDCEVWRTL